MGNRKPIAQEDRGFACGNHENEGVCAACPVWCKGRKAYDARMPQWQVVYPEDLAGY